MEMAKYWPKKEPKFLKFENFVILLLEYEIQWKKTKITLIRQKKIIFFNFYKP